MTHPVPITTADLRYLADVLTALATWLEATDQTSPRQKPNPGPTVSPTTPGTRETPSYAQPRPRRP